MEAPEPPKTGPALSQGAPAPVKPAPRGALGTYRKLKKRLFSGVRLRYERLKQFFMLMPCYASLRSRNDMRNPGWRTAGDLLVLFFSYRTFPDHYERYRLWEVDRGDWKYYYGSNYHPHQHKRLRKAVQPSDYHVIFDDKYLCSLLCKAMDIRTPLTYGVIDPAGDYRARIEAWIRASAAGAVIIKPLFGETGRDIVLAERTDRRIRIRSNKALLELGDYVLKEKAIVQEVVRQDGRMAEFSSASVNTVRIVTMLTRHGDVLIVSAALRAGIGSAIIDNWSAGGIGVGIDCRRGRLMKFAYDKRSRAYQAHPTTGVVFEDRPVPEWDRLSAFAADVQRAFPFYRLLGLDLALDQDGEPVLIEINGAADLTFNEQVAGPLFKNVDVLRAFGDEDLLVNRHQQKLYAELTGRTDRS
jgi:hypothetical protein